MDNFQYNCFFFSDSNVGRSIQGPAVDKSQKTNSSCFGSPLHFLVSAPVGTPSNELYGNVLLSKGA